MDAPDRRNLSALRWRPVRRQRTDRSIARWPAPRLQPDRAPIDQGSFEPRHFPGLRTAADPAFAGL